MLLRKVSILGSVWLLLAGIALGGEAIPNWPTPATWSPHSVGRGLTTMGDVTPPLPFIGVTPCRVVDTRGPNGTFGGPIFAAGQTRTYPLSTNPACPGFPTAATIQAYSVNITVTQTAGTGFVSAYPSGTPRPLVSSVNFIGSGQTVSNAAIVPAGSGNIDVYASQQTHVIIDVNGYYGTATASGNFFLLDTNSASPTMLLRNLSTTCFTTCGFEQVTFSNNSNEAILGLALGTSGQNFGVFGHVYSDTDNSVGVLGQEESTSGQVFGVYGKVVTSHVFGAGVYGQASDAFSNGGFFHNIGAGGTNTYLATQFSGVNFGVATDGRIQGGSLNIVGAPKNFVSPHPLDPSRQIVYASVEAPTVDVYFRGTGTLANGYAHIEVPDHFRFTAREGTYMTTLTPVGRPVSLSVESEGPEGIVVRGSDDTRFHYVVYAERAEIEGYEPVQPNVTFVPAFMEKLNLLKALPRTTRALLIRNGTLNQDGSYSQATARAMGWVLPEPVSQAQPQK